MTAAGGPPTWWFKAVIATLRSGHDAVTLSCLGEKRVLAEVLLPLINPDRSPDLAGDDCAFVTCGPGERLAVSTDRVPWDLTGRLAGVMELGDMGRHLAALNLSDIAAVGGRPVGLLLNLALPSSMTVGELLQIVSGVLKETDSYGVPVLGGDLSSAPQPELSATALGVVEAGKEIRRAGAAAGDLVFVSRQGFIEAAALAYFRASGGFKTLSVRDEQRLGAALRDPHPDFPAVRAIQESNVRATAMDNTDGLAQCLRELSNASGLTARIDCDELALDPIVHRVAEMLGIPPISLAIGPGYDFGLVGTVSRPIAGLSIIGVMEEGVGDVILETPGATVEAPGGWDYWL